MFGLHAWLVRNRDANVDKSLYSLPVVLVGRQPLLRTGWQSVVNRSP